MCVLVNTVNFAQELYDYLEENRDDEEILLFHARFTASDRNELEKEVLSRFDKRSLETDLAYLRPKKAILIATQVVEQSLDLDFDEMITQLSPIDLLIQRVGRVHRHDRKSRPTGLIPILHVMCPFANNPILPRSNVYDRYIQLRTLAVLMTAKEKELREQEDDYKLSFYLSFPSDVRNLIEAVYGEFGDQNTCIESLSPKLCSEMKEKIGEAFRNYLINREKSENKAKDYLIALPNLYEFNFGQGRRPLYEDEPNIQNAQAVKTREDDSTIRVILLSDDFLPDYKINRKTPPHKLELKKLLSHAVSISQYWFKAVEADPEFNKLVKIPWLAGYAFLKMNSNVWCGNKSTRNGIIPVRIEYSKKWGLRKFTNAGMT